MRRMLVKTAVMRHGCQVFKLLDGNKKQIKIVTAREDGHKPPIFYNVTNTRFVENENWIGMPRKSGLSNEDVRRFFRLLDGRVSKVIDVTDEYRKNNGG